MQHQVFWNPSIFETFVEFTTNLAHNATSKEDHAEVSRLMAVEKMAAEELVEGVGIRSGVVVAVAYKPLQ